MKKKVPNPRGRVPVAQGGTPNKRTIEARNIKITAIREGLTPVDIMLKAAYENYDAAIKIVPTEEDEARRIELASTPYDDLTKPEKQELRALEFMIKERRRLMEAAASHADRAAPYVHAKLSSITHSDDPENPVGVAEGFNTFITGLKSIAEGKVMRAMADKEQK